MFEEEQTEDNTFFDYVSPEDEVISTYKEEPRFLIYNSSGLISPNFALFIILGFTLAFAIVAGLVWQGFNSLVQRGKRSSEDQEWDFNKWFIHDEDSGSSSKLEPLFKILELIENFKESMKQI